MWCVIYKGKNVYGNWWIWLMSLTMRYVWQMLPKYQRHFGLRQYCFSNSHLSESLIFLLSKRHTSEKRKTIDPHELRPGEKRFVLTFISFCVWFGGESERESMLTAYYFHQYHYRFTYAIPLLYVFCVRYCYVPTKNFSICLACSFPFGSILLSEKLFGCDFLTFERNVRFDGICLLVHDDDDYPTNWNEPQEK